MINAHDVMYLCRIGFYVLGMAYFANYFLVRMI